MKLSDFSGNRRAVFALYDKVEKDIEEDVRILREWMLKVPHLPSDLIGDDFLQICLLKNKFSIEKCKRKIEMYCTMKGDPKYQYLFSRIAVPSEEGAFFTPLPILTEDYKRLFVGVFNEDTYDMAKDFTNIIVMRELLLRCDYNDGEIYLFDMRNLTSKIFTKVRLNIMADAVYIIMNASSSRISAIHVISPIGRTFFSVVTSLLSKKLASRIYFHNDEASLKMAVPAKYLPKNLGGDLQSIESIKADWDEIYQENQEYLRKLINIKSREELRRSACSTNEELQGTFKRLNID